MKSYTITKMSPACKSIMDFTIPQGEFAFEPQQVKDYFGGIEFIDRGGDPWDYLRFPFVKACHLSLLANVVAAATDGRYSLMVEPEEFDTDDPEIDGSLFQCETRRIKRRPALKKAA